MVNDALESMGIDPKICTTEGRPNTWQLHRGEAQIIAILQESTIMQASKVATLTVMSPIVKASEDPQEAGELYKYLLEVNHKLTTETFSLSNGWVILSATYYIEDMSLREVRQLIDGMSYHAQQFLANLKKEETEK
jgi:hypothetical protein